MSNLHSKRFAELVEQVTLLEKTKHREGDVIGHPRDYVDHDLLLNWRVKALNLIASTCGRDSEHFKEFVEAAKPTMMSTNVEILSRIKAVFLAAREDYDGGYLNTVRNLVHAELKIPLIFGEGTQSER